MGWESASSFEKKVWFDYERDKQKPVIFLMDKPITGLFHQVFAVPNKRSFATMPCDIVDEEWKVGKSVSGLDDVEDPLWDDLKEEQQYRKVDGELQRVDFPLREQNFVFIWNCTTEQVEVLRFGPKMKKEQLTPIVQAFGDITKVKMMISRTGTGFQTRYDAVPLGPHDQDEVVKEAKDSIDIEGLVKLVLFVNDGRLKEIKAGTSPEDK